MLLDGTVNDSGGHGVVERTVHERTGDAGQPLREQQQQARRTPTITAVQSNQSVCLL